MKLLTHPTMEMSGDPTRYFVFDEHHGVEILETRPHPSPRLQGSERFLVCRCRLQPWGVIAWVWWDFISPHHRTASYVRLVNACQR